MTKRLKTNLKKFWYVYALWIALSILLGMWIVSLLTALTAEQKIEVFVGVKAKDEAALFATLDGARPQYAEQVDMYCYAPDSSVYSTFFLTYLSTSDIFVLPTSKINDVGIKAKFAPIDEEFAATLDGATEFWEENGAKYAVKLFDKDSGASFCDRFDFAASGADEDWWLTFGKNSKHLVCDGRDGAYRLAAVILEKE